MNLESLNPKYLRYELKSQGITLTGLFTEHGKPFELTAIETKEIITTVSTQEESNGIEFDCPYCMTPHRVICWRKDVPIFASPARYRWSIEGKDFSTLNVSIAEQNEFVLDRTNQCVWNKPINNGVIS